MSSAFRFERVSPMPCNQSELAAWHFRAGAIHRLIPPWESIEVVREAAPLTDGATADIVIRKGPLKVRLLARHSDVDPGNGFTDSQERGPFASWVHRHRFERADDGARLHDSIEYRLPFGAIGRLALGAPFARELRRQFRFRHLRTAADLRRHQELAARFGERSLRIGITGASGFVGRQLSAFLTTGGHQVIRFVRGAAKSSNERSWNPADPDNGVDPRSVEDLDAVVHLAGAGIADTRWTESRKREILESRVQGTQAVANAMARSEGGHKALISASAIGYYGNAGDTPVDEHSTPGAGFLAEVVAAWEDAAGAARAAGVRVVHPRIGVVLSASGGALAKMRLPFSIGAGGPIGNGRQGMSWISLDDALGAFLFTIMNQQLAGPVNFVAPNPIAQRGFARVLGRVLRRPAFAPLPRTAVRIMFGELGERLLLEGAFVVPAQLQRSGFRFEHGSLEQALRLELGRFDDATEPEGLAE